MNAITSNIFNISFDTSAFIWSILFSLLSVLGIYWFGLIFFRGQLLALFCTLIIFCFPFSFYYSMFYTEAVFMTFTIFQLYLYPLQTISIPFITINSINFNSAQRHHYPYTIVPILFGTEKNYSTYKY